MRRTKALFGLMIIFFLSLILFSGLFYQGFFTSSTPQSPENAITGYTFLETPLRQRECSLALPAQRTIVVRIDDYRAYSYYPAVVNVTDTFLSHEIPITIGVIPKDIDRDHRFLRWINNVRTNPQIEIALHGFSHSPYEFKKMNETEATYWLRRALTLLQENVGVTPVTFIPPYDEYSQGTLKALQNSTLRIVSAGYDEYKFDGVLSHIDYTAHTLNYSETGFIKVNQVRETCEKSLEEKNVCVVLFHVQDYLTEDGTQIDHRKYDHLLELIANLKVLEAQFKLMKDLVVCQELDLHFDPWSGLNENVRRE